MIRAAELDMHLDLRPLIAYLGSHQVQCRVTEESGRQVIWVRHPQEVELVRGLLAEWQRNGFQVSGGSSGTGQGMGEGLLPLRGMLAGLLRGFHEAPITLTLIAACLLVAVLSQGGAVLGPVRVLFYPAFVPGGDTGLLALLGQISGPGDVLRMLSPVLLHFGIIHLVFNMLWLWYLGRMIEATQPVWLYAGLLILLALSGNTAQFLMSWQSNFGGMSGVVYGLLGFTGSWQNLNPRHPLRLPPAMIGFFVLALVLMEVFASSWIATAAHVGGLIGGVVLGLLAGFWHRLASRRMNA